MPTKKNHPIILAHGITRPDCIIDFIKRKLNVQAINLVSDKFHYFKGIASFLRHHGFEVYHTSVSFAADVETRAQDLTREVQIYASSQKRDLTFRLFQKTWQIIYDREGDNEGLVSVKSQKWEDRLVGKGAAVKAIKQHDFPVPADHVNQMGWWHWNGAQWNAQILKEKKEFEMVIKNVYLQMARDVSKDI